MLDLWATSPFRAIRAVIDALSVARPLPEFLYHYTNAEAVKNILESRSLWLSHSNYLNDMREFTFTRDSVIGRLASFASPPNSSTHRDTAITLYEGMRGRSMDFYVFSLSENRDQLSQWRAYTGHFGGYSIGLRSALLQSVAREFGALLVPVSYGEGPIAKLFDPLFKACVDACHYDSSKLSRESISHFFFEAIGHLARMNKHEAFSEEAEWRLIFWQTFADERLRISTRPRGPYLVPYVSVDIQNGIDKEVALESQVRLLDIVVGPGFDQGRAQKGLVYLLRSCGLHDRCSYGPSSAPYRTD